MWQHIYMWWKWIKKIHYYGVQPIISDIRHYWRSVIAWHNLLVCKTYFKIYNWFKKYFTFTKWNRKLQKFSFVFTEKFQQNLYNEKIMTGWCKSSFYFPKLSSTSESKIPLPTDLNRFIILFKIITRGSLK